jgi:hypothetical protein
MLKCDDCGKFVSFKDLFEEMALRSLLTPDSHFTEETYETLCKRCYTPPKELKEGV